MRIYLEHKHMDSLKRKIFDPPPLITKNYASSCIKHVFHEDLNLKKTLSSSKGGAWHGKILPDCNYCLKTFSCDALKRLLKFEQTQHEF